MLSYIVGQVDWNSAAVLCTFFITVCIITTAQVAKHRSKRELEMQFEVDQLKLRNDDAANKRQQDRVHEFDMAKLATERDVQFKRIESGLIEGTKVVKSNFDG
jgi:hypothetical protein